MSRSLVARGLVLATALATPTVACSREEPKPAAAAPASAAGQAVTLSAEAKQAVEAAFAAYERARALLADDQTEGLADAAAAIEKEATRAAAGAPAPLKAELDALADAARKLREGAGDVEAARKTFGDVSRPLVAIGAAVPALAQGRHVFRCPMAPGYQKWVQTAEKMANPYMGKKMLECGAKADWKA